MTVKTCIVNKSTQMASGTQKNEKKSFNCICENMLRNSRSLQFNWSRIFAWGYKMLQ